MAIISSDVEDQELDREEDRDITELEGVELLADMFLASQPQSQEGEEVETIFSPKPNIADMFDDDTLLKIGRQAKEGYEADQDSMTDWIELVDFGLDLVKQETQSKSTPWDGAANFKSPELNKAALKFSDRASSELLRDYNLMKPKVIGKDPEGLKLERGERISEFGNWQLNVDMPEWRDEHEKLIYRLPYVGAEFKKTFFDAQLGRNTSKLVKYPNFAVNQDTDSITRLRRFSEIHDFSKNEIIEKQRQGIWLDIDINFGDREDETDEESAADKFTSFIEQDGYFDLDGDGYEEPYTFVFQESTGTVVRIMPRFEPKDVLIKDEQNNRASTLDRLMQGGRLPSTTGEREVVRISPNIQITKYGFMHDPQGGFLDVGYTHLLSAIVSGINTTTNQLVDAGTLANLQGGWVARGFRKKMGSSSFKPGEWKQTGISAQDLQNGIRPLPFKEPSPTLLALMQFMKADVQELAASADLKGALGTNAPVGTTLALIDEQMQGTGAIVKRIYRSMSSEFRKLFELNAKFADPEQYQDILDDPQADFAQDFNLRGMDIVPVANPEISTKTQRIFQANAEVSIADKLALVGIDARPLYKSFLEAIGSSVVDEVFPEEAPEERLQRLLAENPQLEQLILGEQERLDLIAAAQAEALEREQAREDAKLAMDLDKGSSEVTLNEAKTIKTLEEAESEDQKNAVSTYTTALQLDNQELQNQQALQQLNQPQGLNDGQSVSSSNNVSQ
jgi:chaperonin GroES